MGGKGKPIRKLDTRSHLPVHFCGGLLQKHCYVCLRPSPGTRCRPTPWHHYRPESDVKQTVIENAVAQTDYEQ
jgi:hypothetical protein